MTAKRLFLSFLAIFMLSVFCFNIVGCTQKKEAENLMEGIEESREIKPLGDYTAQKLCAADFAVSLFKNVYNDKNTLVSPLSVMYALSLTANGASNETLKQMESTLGMTSDDLNQFLYTYQNSLSQGENYKLSLANSIWFTDDELFKVNQEFLQKNANYFDAEIYKIPFDSKAKDEINSWVNNRTDGMIDEIIDQVPSDAIMYLVNALAFDAEWDEPYKKHEVRNGKFTKQDGTKQDAEFMYCNESAYLEDENATGFIKYYKGGKYAFAALLPNDGVGLSDYIDGLDGERIYNILSSPKSALVKTAIPKFETEFSIEMSSVLASMGMTDAFDKEKADFSMLGNYLDKVIYINRVLHKTFISVGENGTRAGAVTVVEMLNDSSIGFEGEIKTVYLDRPFVYMLIDCENNLPFFIGAIETVDG